MSQPDDLADLFRDEPFRALVGPTAAGKSALALELCERLSAELVSLDSMQVYRGMDVGTAKPGPAERARVPHHMLDLVEPPERYDVRRYRADVRAVLQGILGRGSRPLFVGGTAFYLKALTEGLFAGPPSDPALRAEIVAHAREVGAPTLHRELAAVDPRSAARLHENDTRRVVRALEVWRQTGRPLSDWQREWGWHGERSAPRLERRIVGIEVEVGELDRRIRSRAEEMIDAGWPEEALRIREGVGFGPTSGQALGYAEVLELVDGRSTRAECVERITLRTRQFARRQRTWYRRLEDARWIEGGGAVEEALAWLEGRGYA